MDTAMSKSNTNLSLTRRDFLQVSGAAVAGLTVTPLFAAPKNDTLALSGGARTVTVAEARQQAVFRWPRYGEAEQQAVQNLLRQDEHQVYRPLVQLEQEWKAYLNVPFVKNHFNGTSALTSMYFALDLPPGSEVLVPTLTFFATIVPMRLFGYVPIFVDSDPNTRCFDLNDAKRKLTARTRAMVPMHPGGMPCDMDEINDFAKEKGLIVTEDAAHAHGASLKGKKMGAWGDNSIFSYQASKPLPTLEGGMGVYQKRESFERATAFGHYDGMGGFPKDSPYHYEGTGLGLKLRMHPVAAALGREQLRGLDQRNAETRRLVRQINDRLLQLPGISEPRCRPDAERVYYPLNMLHLDAAKAGFSRSAMLKALQAEGVRATPGHYLQQHTLRIYSEAKWWHHPPVVPQGDLPGCHQCNQTSFNIPLFYEDEPELMEQYVRAFEKVWAHKGELA
jgi:perosamine synthetase